MTGIDKNAVLAALRERMQAGLAALTAAQRTQQEGAVHPENRQEHSKDTRATEAAYIARGLAERVETQREGLRLLDQVRVKAFGDGDAAASGALVRLRAEGGRESLCFLAPCGAGEVLAVDGHDVLVLTPRSPVGGAVAGRSAGDEITVDLPSGRFSGWIEDIE